MRFEPRVIEVGPILTSDVALYSMAEEVLFQLDAFAGDQYSFDLEKRKISQVFFVMLAPEVQSQ